MSGWKMTAEHARSLPWIKRAITLAKEGMPSTWIAEDVGRSREHVRIALKAVGVTAGTGFRSEWTGIRVNPTLYSLHRELQPANAGR